MRAGGGGLGGAEPSSTLLPSLKPSLFGFTFLRKELFGEETHLTGAPTLSIAKPIRCRHFFRCCREPLRFIWSTANQRHQQHLTFFFVLLCFIILTFFWHRIPFSALWIYKRAQVDMHFKLSSAAVVERVSALRSLSDSQSETVCTRIFHCVLCVGYTLLLVTVENL